MNELDHKKINNSKNKRNYFTQVPNFIVDNSNANELALYVHIKRITGESGECFTTQQTMMKKMGKGKKAFDKSLKYLISQDWIISSGKKQGKTRPINKYRINNIWEMNLEHYEKINSKSNISLKDNSQKTRDKSRKKHMISPESNTEEDLVLRRTNEEEAGRGKTSTEILQGNQWNELIDPFQRVNPMWRTFYKNKTERHALQVLVTEMGFEKVKWLVEHLKEVVSKPYAPKISKPTELLRDIGKLMVYWEQGKQSKNKNSMKIGML